MSGCGNGIFWKHELYAQKLPWSSPIYHTNLGGWQDNRQEKAGNPSPIGGQISTGAAE